MYSYRRANYIQLTTNRQALDLLNTNYTDIKFALPAVRKIFVTDAFEANLPGIAYQLWGDPDFGYWWVLGLFNGIIDPINDVVRGRVLLIPDINDIKRFSK